MKKITFIIALTLVALVSRGQSKITEKKKVDTPSISAFSPTAHTLSPQWKPLQFVYQVRSNAIMTISMPDSTKTVTVKISRKLVHFINDSTFTFKQQ